MVVAVQVEGEEWGKVGASGRRWKEVGGSGRKWEEVGGSRWKKVVGENAKTNNNNKQTKK